MEKRRQARHRNYLLEDRERDGSLVQMNYVFLKATGEQAELEHEARSTALAVAHLGTDSRVSLQGKTRVLSGLQKTTFTAFLCRCVMQVLTSFLKRLCLETVIVQTAGEPARRELTERLAKVRQKPT